MADKMTVTEAMRAMFARREWGDHTAFSIAATFSDDQGNFEVALLDRSGQPVWEPVQCNVSDLKGELDAVMNEVLNLYQDWQTDRYERVGEWKTEVSE